MDTIYITHPECFLHDMGSWHPESPDRLDAIHDQLMSSGVLDFLLQESPNQANDIDILRVHDKKYLEYLNKNSPAKGTFNIDADTIMTPKTLSAARFAAGAGIAAVDALMSDKGKTAFCAVRPPGHHATPSQSMGFCFFNNIAVAASYALQVYNLERVAIIDFDVHHGNGTEDIFAKDNRVLMCGIYQDPLYPNICHSPPADNMVNIPVVAGTMGDEICQIVSDIWLPRLYEFKPQMVFISAGFDSHREDDMGQIRMTEDDYAWITSELVELAGTTADGRIVSMLEGGYNLSALGRSVVAHIRSLSKL